MKSKSSRKELKQNAQPSCIPEFLRGNIIREIFFPLIQLFFTAPVTNAPFHRI